LPTELTVDLLKFTKIELAEGALRAEAEGAPLVPRPLTVGIVVKQVVQGLRQ
jgi:hypothetical protein